MSAASGAGHTPAPFADWLDIDDGTWRWMLKEPQKGYGIIPWVMPGYECLHGNQSVTDSVGRDPWITPALCAWEWLVDEEGDPRFDIYDSIDTRGVHGQTYSRVPLLWLSRIWIPDPEARESLDFNTLAQQTIRGGWGDGTVPNSQGIVPVWSVVPIERPYAKVWKAQLSDFWTERSFDLAGVVCQCSRVHGYTCLSLFPQCPNDNEGPCADDCDCEVYKEDEDGEVMWGECDCGYDEARTDWFELANKRPDPIVTGSVDYEPEAFISVWEYALERHSTGWAKAHEVEGRDAWSFSFSRPLSPYWESSGRAVSTPRFEPLRSTA